MQAKRSWLVNYLRSLRDSLDLFACERRTNWEDKISNAEIRWVLGGWEWIKRAWMLWKRISLKSYYLCHFQFPPLYNPCLAVQLKGDFHVFINWVQFHIAWILSQKLFAYLNTCLLANKGYSLSKQFSDKFFRVSGGSPIYSLFLLFFSLFSKHNPPPRSSHRLFNTVGVAPGKSGSYGQMLY